MPPDYASFSRAELTKKLEQVRDAVLSETDAVPAEVDAAYERSQYFIDGSFDFYEGKRDLGRKIGRAFVVSMRSDRQDDNYASESTPFYPLLDPVRFGVTSEIRMRTMYGVPPTVLDTYLKSGSDHEAGALVLCPLYNDMQRDIRPDRNSAAQKIELLQVGACIIEKTAHFAHVRLGADVVGLGALLPKLTNFGHALRSFGGMEKLTTTTGHGGTVYTIVETARKVMEETSVESHGKIGVIGGAGSIGWSSSVAALEMITGHTVLTYDMNIERLHGLIGANHLHGWIDIAQSAAEVLKNCSIILTAVTSHIDLDDKAYEDIDLTGKVIIDDSQPGAFTGAQVEAKGGKLIWVVGEDGSDSQFITRDGLYTNGTPYNYGDSSGLFGHRSEFACGQEAAVIAQSREFDKAVTGPVTPDDVRAIGALLRAAGVRVAPFQAFGQAVAMELA